ncbi:hypothetical protein P170DRAFT_364977 [Aspergillus steynii IBT 23096]|uniref:Uncharacterized protein n=1 Tax=Aspergillus steynii IBT 23096 TaxID=1392250 RepID=A0A2I2FYY9_9EURO|nr:uncharacterized protein P170DRAFT_364977 [Aspergillus steynii IBT 23096]PLB45838.1 hypothetical protein P170DRAFT_364977 [Aspergillus steynii IBT 23096]
MPIKAPPALSVIDEYRKYLQFQSTIDVLKDPPSGYMVPAIDLMGGLDQIQDNIRNGKYHSQYEADEDLQRLIQSANDGHLSVRPCSTSYFEFTHQEPLVSISSDGLQLPQVYTLNDAKLLGKGSKNVSPLKSINGTDVVEYLEKYTSLQGSQDPDARYNVAFPSLSRSSKTAKGLWASTEIWPGPSSDFKFTNGTVKNVETRATSDIVDFSYRNGTAVYNRFCSPTALPGPSNSSSSKRFMRAAAGYPKPNFSDKNNVTFGFFSNETALRDTAVLSVPTFDALPSATTEFAASFLRNATAAGKKKIIIDLSGNPGGVIVSGINLFQVFFPGEPMYIGSRFRAHPAVDFIGRSFGHLNESAQLGSLANESNPFPYKMAVTPDQEEAFASWKELYGPHEILGANMSSLAGVYNYTALSSASDLYPINGYGSVPQNPAKALFAPEDITIITDGFCASTCTTFVKLMKSQGVRSIAFGGRPRHEPMQAMGGVKGSQSIDIGFIYSWISTAHELVAKSLRGSKPIMSRQEWKQYNETLPISAQDFPLHTIDGGLNLRNAYVQSDTETPLQFVYEAAECRLFYTLGNYLRQESVWSAAARAMFGNGTCVEGSTGGKGSLDEK